MLIAFGTIIVPLSSVHGLTPPQLGIVRWNSAKNRFQRFDSEVNWKSVYLLLSVYVVTIAGDIGVSEAASHESKSSCPQGCNGASYSFSDYTSGNRRKQWH